MRQFVLMIAAVMVWASSVQGETDRRPRSKPNAGISYSFSAALGTSVARLTGSENGAPDARKLPPDSAALSEYLTSIDRYGFYKVLVSGTMDDDNLIATCAAAGMRHACFHSGTGACAFHWSPDCIKYDHDGVSCITTENLAQILCGDPDKLYCPPLDDVFLVRPNYWGEVVGWGIDVDTHQHFGDGSSYNNMYALCAGKAGACYHTAPRKATATCTPCARR
ncbi:hypothetical protein Bbelb_058190 [Branchiostoma belcheri]|nr:hypothetical protein Bbelb_058190 [Branchiostoma belcheri]